MERNSASSYISPLLRTPVWFVVNFLVRCRPAGNRIGLRVGRQQEPKGACIGGPAGRGRGGVRGDFAVPFELSVYPRTIKPNSSWQRTGAHQPEASKRQNQCYLVESLTPGRPRGARLRVRLSSHSRSRTRNGLGRVRTVARGVYLVFSRMNEGLAGSAGFPLECVRTSVSFRDPVHPRTGLRIPRRRNGRTRGEVVV